MEVARGVVLVVLPDTEFRRGLQGELRALGFDVIVASDWSTAVAAESVPAIDAVLFETGHEAADLAAARARLEELRAANPRLVPMPLGVDPNPTQPNPTRICL